ncbi:MAG TPA: tetratricopeptide repeat protein, partial [Burkholderiales bacterium]
AKSVETSPAAYAAFLEGRQFANRDTRLDVERAIDYFELALKIDPNYAVALGAIAECRVYQAIRRYIAPRDAEASARAACQRALTIDRDLVSPHAALGWIEGAIAWNDDAAIAALNEALALDPGYARGYYYRGWILRSMGQHEQALDDLRRACAINPYSISHHGALAYSLFCAGQSAAALDVAREVIKIMPMQAPGYTHAATYAAYLNEHKEAIAAGRRSIKLSRRDSTQMVGLAYALARAGRRAEASALAREMTEADRPAAVRSLIAPVFAALGDREQAVRWLERAAEERCPWFRSVLADPRLAELEEVKKFQRLVGNTVLGSL